MVICEETGLKYVIPSATTLTKNPVKTNKKAKARNQLEIDEETGLKTTIDYYILWVSFFSCWDVICGCIYAAFFHFITALV
jgi:hypothetical protein